MEVVPEPEPTVPRLEEVDEVLVQEPEGLPEIEKHPGVPVLNQDLVPANLAHAAEESKRHHQTTCPPSPRTAEGNPASRTSRFWCFEDVPTPSGTTNSSIFDIRAFFLPMPSAYPAILSPAGRALTPEILSASASRL